MKNKWHTFLCSIPLALLIGCSEQVADDQYPEVKTSERYAIGQFKQSIDLSVNSHQKATMVVGELCEMAVEISRFGNHSIQIEPKSIICQDTQTYNVLDSSKISNAYKDVRFFKLGYNVRFELYVNDWDSIAQTKANT